MNNKANTGHGLYDLMVNIFQKILFSCIKNSCEITITLYQLLFLLISTQIVWYCSCCLFALLQ